MFKTLAFLAIIGFVCGVPYFKDETSDFNLEDIEAYHFHIYIFDVNPRHAEEALALRRQTRELINTGVLDECSLNQVRLRNN